ncbi:hypothetical protein ACFQ6C_26680 [Streptomyces sp. NPDC056454]|uniref:hypothetical protein n=1 Tax=Streptomyces sp. NPDC056454 TaxID=3345823 RepID=UPI00368E318F
MNVPRMVRKYAQDAHKSYVKELEVLQHGLSSRPSEIDASHFESFYAARVLYTLYAEPLALDAVGNTAYNDAKVMERITDARATQLRWLLQTKHDGGGMNAITLRLAENAARRFLSNTDFVDLEDEGEVTP